MRRPAFFWATTLGTLVGVDYWCAKNATTGDSLSECTRAAFRTHTPLGRVAFIAGWTGLTALLVPHICRAAAEAVGDAIDRADLGN